MQISNKLNIQGCTKFHINLICFSEFIPNDNSCKILYMHHFTILVIFLFAFYVSSHTDIPFGDKDQDGEYTLSHGDVVEFSIATDRRDKLQRATKIVLLNETFDKTTERRETVRLSTTC